MKYFLFALLYVLIVSLSAFGDEVFALSNDTPANYHIEAELDTSLKMIYGRETIEFLNPTTEPLDEIILHLYPNAFRDTTTTMAIESERIRSDLRINRGYINCDSILVDGERADSILIDETLMHIFPNEPLQPGRRLSLSLVFEIRIPKIRLRYGYDENGNYLISHWHPILAGYQHNKAIVFQYGVDGEFFSNFANYEIKLAIPEGYKLLSTANINIPDSTVSGLAYYDLIAEGVIDFAFACGPGWLNEAYNHNGVNINLFYLEQHSDNMLILKKTLNGSLDYFGEKFYPYPYPNLSFVDISPGAEGMELPRMVAMSFETRNGGPSRIKMIAIHELAHQWFYATVATNEYTEPWLDEGITSYVTNRCADNLYGRVNEFEIMGFGLSLELLQGLAARTSGYLDPLNKTSDEFKSGDYYINVYARAPIVLRALEGVLGTGTFDKAMKDFTDSHKFKHPDSYDFKRALEQSSGVDLESFFNQYIFGTARVDYKIQSVESPKSDSLYITSVDLQRIHDGVLPQQVVVGFRDGSKQSKRWDGIDKYTSLSFESNSPAEYARLDTSYYYLIDEDLINNSYRIEPDSAYTFAFSSLLMTLVQLILIIVGLV